MATTLTFPLTDPLAADVLGARAGACPVTGAEAIDVAIQVDGEEPQVFSFTICSAYHLREVLDAALEAPFHWDDDADESDAVLTAALEQIDAMFDPEIVDLARSRSVRWDETWARSHPR